MVDPNGNIGASGRRRRRIMGWACLALATGVAGALLAFDAARAWRLATYLPFWMGALGLIQAKEKT